MEAFTDPTLAPGPLLASGPVNLDLDPTLFMHMILFTAFAVLMKDLVFDPLMRVFEERERRTAGAIEQARKMDEEAITLKQEYETRLEAIRREAATDREQQRARVKKIENELLEEARGAMATRLAAGMEGLRAEVDAIRTDLGRKRAPLAAEIATKVLGRAVRSEEGRT
jgi:F-type H+-transporting ATPase subunit b